MYMYVVSLLRVQVKINTTGVTSGAGTAIIPEYLSSPPPPPPPMFLVGFVLLDL